MAKEQIILIYGNEEYLIDNYVKELKDKYCAENDMNFSRVEKLQGNIQSIIDFMITISFFCAKKIILIENCQSLTSQKSSDEYEEKKIIDYLENKNDENIIIFQLKNQNPDSRKKIVKLIKEKGSMIKYDKFYENELTSWIYMYLSKNNRNISKKNAKYISEITGYIGRDSQKNLYDIKNELDKLIGYTNKNTEISIKEIDEAVIASVDNNIFRLIDCMIEGNKEESYKIYHDIIINNIAPMFILYMIARQFRILKHYYLLYSEGADEKEIIKEMKIQSFISKKLKNQIQKLNYREIDRYNKKCLEIDRKIKSGKISDFSGVEILIMM